MVHSSCLIWTVTSVTRTKSSLQTSDAKPLCCTVAVVHFNGFFGLSDVTLPVKLHGLVGSSHHYLCAHTHLATNWRTDSRILYMGNRQFECEGGERMHVYMCAN
eukprot:scpid104884/ scgid22923/ 